MSAVRNMDIGPVQTLTTMLTVGDKSWPIDVKYRVDYQDRRKRGFGVDPDVTILSVTYEQGVERKDLLLPGLYNELIRIIELDEMGE